MTTSIVWAPKVSFLMFLFVLLTILFSISTSASPSLHLSLVLSVPHAAPVSLCLQGSNGFCSDVATDTQFPTTKGRRRMAGTTTHDHHNNKCQMDDEWGMDNKWRTYNEQWWQMMMTINASMNDEWGTMNIWVNKPQPQWITTTTVPMNAGIAMTC